MIYRLNRVEKKKHLNYTRVSITRFLYRNCFSGITEFQKNSGEFINILDNLAEKVENEKMKTIGARNLLRSVEKQRDAQKQQIQVFKSNFCLVLVLNIELFCSNYRH